MTDMKQTNFRDEIMARKNTKARFKARVRSLVEREVDTYYALIAVAAGSDAGEQLARAQEARISAARAAVAIERLLFMEPEWGGDLEIERVRGILGTIHNISWKAQSAGALFDETQKLLAAVARFPSEQIEHGGRSGSRPSHGYEKHDGR